MPQTLKTYGEKLKDPRWQALRLRVFKRDKFTCQHCGNKSKTLNVHHIEYKKSEPWESEMGDLLTLCEDCHLIFHNLEKFTPLEQLIIQMLQQWTYRELNKVKLKKPKKTWFEFMHTFIIPTVMDEIKENLNRKHR